MCSDRFKPKSYLKLIKKFIFSEGEQFPLNLRLIAHAILKRYWQFDICKSSRKVREGIQIIRFSNFHHMYISIMTIYFYWRLITYLLALKETVHLQNMWFYLR